MINKTLLSIYLTLISQPFLIAQSTVWTKTLDFGPIIDVSVALYDIDNDGKDEIFIGTVKALDGSKNEIRPAGLICLEDDGSIKWTRTFPAIDGADPTTGKTYNTTSVTSTPFFANIDDDPEMEIIVGVGADISFNGGPGDKGGVYALEHDGSIKWFHQSLDTIGGASNIGDGKPDGVHGSPIVYDIDNDGEREVIYTSWDQYLWILDAATGTVERKLHLLDTIWSTPAIADLNNDKKEEILITADITTNATVGTTTGGIFHVISGFGVQNIPGFDQPVANPSYEVLRGKYEEQPLWSSPVTGDIDKDGFLEIVYGTGNFFQDGRGEYIKVWNHDGTLKFKLDTIGRTFATPLIADIDNDGNLDIVAATWDGYIYAWDNHGQVIFSTRVDGNPILSSPIAVDINGNGKLEIIYSSGQEITILDANGNRVNGLISMLTHSYLGSPAIKDIDNNGLLDLISGGTTSEASHNQGVVYRWALSGSNTNARVGKYQYIGSNTKVEEFVSRFYQETLNRTADVTGLHDWTEKLVTGAYAGADIARGFIFSKEFTDKHYGNLDFVTILFKAFFNRNPDDGGLNYWLTQLNDGATEAKVLDGFLFSEEFTNLTRSFNIKPTKELSTNGVIETFVQRFYESILGRPSDSAGLSDWVNQLASGTKAGSDIARGFIFSEEFTKVSRTSTEYVKVLYAAFFGRAADPSGLNGWVSAIDSGRLSRERVLDGFLFSDEFSALSQSYGIIAVK